MNLNHEEDQKDIAKYPQPVQILAHLTMSTPTCLVAVIDLIITHPFRDEFVVRDDGVRRTINDFLYAALTDRYTKNILQDFLNLPPGYSQRIQICDECRDSWAKSLNVFFRDSPGNRMATLGALSLVNLILNDNDRCCGNLNVLTGIRLLNLFELLPATMRTYLRMTVMDFSGREDRLGSPFMIGSRFLFFLLLFGLLLAVIT